MVAAEKMMYTPHRHCDERAGASEEAIHSVARGGGDGSVGSFSRPWQCFGLPRRAFHTRSSQ